jgi:hypothetical protein
MLKEAHTISYIQQASHEWIEGDEEETAYAQATESLKVVPTNIQHGPEVLQRFKQPTSPWSKLCLVLRTWRAMVNRLSQYFVS